VALPYTWVDITANVANTRRHCSRQNKVSGFGDLTVLR